MTKKNINLSTETPEKSATRHFKIMGISSMILLVLIPLFIFTFGRILGSDYQEVRAYYAQPFPALVAILTFIVGFYHFNLGAHMMINDYTRLRTRKILLTLCLAVSYSAMLLGCLALFYMLF